MGIKSELEGALKEAMRANDAVRKSTLRLVLSAIKEAEVQKQAELDEAALLGILQKEVKTRQESSEEAKAAGRKDLVEAARAEIAVLEEFLPEPMNDEDLTKLIVEAIYESGAASMADMGKVMKVVLAKVEGRADGGKVSQLVREKLQGD